MMDIQWRDLGAAVALYLVLEGILPFLSPPLAQRAFRRMADAGPAQLRIVGLGSMLAGLALLYGMRG
jgi:uncharacterized protein YjeT (DUF2065 family)